MNLRARSPALMTSEVFTMLIQRRAWIQNWINDAVAVSACILATLGCGVDNTYMSHGEVQQAIAGGEVDAEETWAGVVYLRTKVGTRTQLCTGTLVAPNVVVTAMHCVALLDGGDFECDYAGNIIQARPGAGELGNAVEPGLVEIRVGFDAVSAEIAAHGKQIFTTNSANICTNDLAFVILDADLDLPFSPLRLREETTLGEALTIVGYGRTEGTNDSTVRRFREMVRVTDLGTDDASNPLSAAPPRTLVVGPSACEGDSGGPAFAPNKSGHGSDEQYAIAGVNSIAVGTCGTNNARSVFTRLDPFKSLIEQVFTVAGHVVWEEGQTVPGEELPEPEPTTAPTPSKPDSTDTSASKPRRLTTGCSVHASSITLVHHWASFTCALGCLVLVARRNSRPNSRR
jgi:Trypsin